MGVAPNPQFPEKPTYVYERKMAPSIPGNRGPLRFEEGLATDTDIPDSFMAGLMHGYQTPPGAPNHNMKFDTVDANQTVMQRAHVGSSSWVEATTFLQEFAGGAFSERDEPQTDIVSRSGGHYMRLNPAVVTD